MNLDRLTRLADRIKLRVQEHDSQRIVTCSECCKDRAFRLMDRLIEWDDIINPQTESLLAFVKGYIEPDLAVLEPFNPNERIVGKREG